MNVLIYSGSEVHPTSLDNTLALLSAISLPNYTVQPLSKASFIKEPWNIGCKLLVIPYLNPGSQRTGEQTKPLDIFGPKQVKQLRTFVEQDGGAILGFGLGAKWEETDISSLEKTMFSLNLGFGGGSSGRDEDLKEILRFQDKVLNSYIIPQVHNDTAQEDISGTTGDNAAVTQANIVASESLEKVPSLSVVRAIGKGSVGFIRPTLTTPANEIPEALTALVHSAIIELGLQLPPLQKGAGIALSSTASGPPKSLPQFFTSIPSVSLEEPAKSIVSSVIHALFPSSNPPSMATPTIGTIKDTANTFLFVPLGSDGANAALESSRNETLEEPKEKVIIVCPDGVLPPKELTPKFDIALYYDELRKLKTLDQASLRFPVVPESAPTNWDIGDAVIYGERVTSTQSLLDRNPQLLTSLPTPILSLASQQVSGRGRGKNVWLSPDGCLMFSLLLRIELDPGGTKSTSSSLKGGSKTTETGKTSKTSKTTATGTKTTATGAKTTASGPELKTAATGAKTTASGPELKTTESTQSSELKSTSTSSLKSASTAKTIGLPASLRSNKLGATSYSASSPQIPASSLPQLPASRLVFIQYLFALAVSEACRLPDVLGPNLGKRVRLKWPNDIYLDLSDEGVGENPKDWSQLKKIGGVLVNTNFGAGGKVEIVIGCGLNVLNELPITSLAQLRKQLSGPGAAKAKELSMEKTAAAIMTVFERMWSRFIHDHGSFAPFENIYLTNWLHQDQRVTLTTVDPPQPVRIVGITPDYGLLRTTPDNRSTVPGATVGSVGLGVASMTSYSRYVYPGGEQKEYIDLQPDGNSFDLMAGLIKAKTN